MEVKRNVYLIYFEGEIVDEVLGVSEKDALYQYGGSKISSKFKAVKN